jgi:phosphoglycolate phosphatase
MTHIDLVLFDLDGTLVDTAPDIADAVNAVLRARRLPALPEAWVRDRIGNGARALMEQAHAEARRLAGGRSAIATPHALEDDFALRYAACCGQRGKLYPGALAVLRRLRDAGVHRALVTNKERRFAELVLSMHGLREAFDVEVCGDTLPAKKPDPLPARHCLEKLSVTPAAAVLVGDSAGDVQCARGAGVAAWAVSYGYNGGAPVALARPDRLLGSLDEVAALAGV